MANDPPHFFGDATANPDWARLGQHLPYEWIEQALACTGKASIRKRRLSAEQVAWLGIALTLYRRQSISEVVDELDLALPDMNATFVSGNFMHPDQCGQQPAFRYSGQGNIRWEIVEETAEDALVIMRVSPQARKKCPILSRLGACAPLSPLTRAGAGICS